MTILNVADSARLAGVEPSVIHEQIKTGVISKTAQGIDLSELIRVYPDLKPLASLKIRQVKKQSAISKESLSIVSSASDSAANSDTNTGTNTEISESFSSENNQSDTVTLLQRELEWNKALLEQTNQRLTQQIEEQRKLIKDQARRLDEKDQFWSKQLAQAQALLPSPESMKRKKFLGIF